MTHLLKKSLIEKDILVLKFKQKWLFETKVILKMFNTESQNITKYGKVTVLSFSLYKMPIKLYLSE